MLDYGYKNGYKTKSPRLVHQEEQIGSESGIVDKTVPC
jgi:hypothetical protein